MAVHFGLHHYRAYILLMHIALVYDVCSKTQIPIDLHSKAKVRIF